jgi:hypothetical protein
MSFQPVSRLLVAIALASLGSLPPVFVQSQTAPPTLSKDARNALKDKWPGWQLAEIDVQGNSACLDARAPSPVVQADIDSDGHPDVAAAIRTAQGVRLVALISRPGHYDTYDIDALGDTVSAAFLGIQPRGSSFRKVGEWIDHFYSADTLAAYQCGKPTAAYLWNGFRFLKIMVEQM